MEYEQCKLVAISKVGCDFASSGRVNYRDILDTIL